MFLNVLPIHFLNSRALGVGVGRKSPNRFSQKDSILGFSTGMRKCVSLQTLTTDHLEGQQSTADNLFACNPTSDGVLESLLEHAQNVTMWVAMEICSAPSVKVILSFCSRNLLIILKFTHIFVCLFIHYLYTDVDKQFLLIIVIIIMIKIMTEIVKIMIML